MIYWIVFFVLQFLLALTALVASNNARVLARIGYIVRAEAFCTLAYCLFVILGVIFMCTISSELSVIGLLLTAVWVLMAWRERRFAALLPA